VTGRSPSDPPTEEGTVMMRFGILKAEGEAGEWQLGLQTSVGRTPENEVCIPKPDVSRRHATIALTETGYVITDLKSGNGTYVNDERIEKRPLTDGDRIRIGSTRFVFKTAEPE
jgi:predicted component of type VI protein secretion system